MGVQIYYDLIEEEDFSEFKRIYEHGDLNRLHSYREGIDKLCRSTFAMGSESYQIGELLKLYGDSSDVWTGSIAKNLMEGEQRSLYECWISYLSPNTLKVSYNFLRELNLQDYNTFCEAMMRFSNIGASHVELIREKLFLESSDNSYSHYERILNERKKEALGLSRGGDALFYRNEDSVGEEDYMEKLSTRTNKPSVVKEIERTFLTYYEFVGFIEKAAKKDSNWLYISAG